MIFSFQFTLRTFKGRSKTTSILCALAHRFGHKNLRELKEELKCLRNHKTPKYMPELIGLGKSVHTDAKLLSQIANASVYILSGQNCRLAQFVNKNTKRFPCYLRRSLTGTYCKLISRKNKKPRSQICRVCKAHVTIHKTKWLRHKIICQYTHQNRFKRRSHVATMAQKLKFCGYTYRPRKTLLDQLKSLHIPFDLKLFTKFTGRVVYDIESYCRPVMITRGPNLFCTPKLSFSQIQNCALIAISYKIGDMATSQTKHFFEIESKQYIKHFVNFLHELSDKHYNFLTAGPFKTLFYTLDKIIAKKNPLTYDRTCAVRKKLDGHCRQVFCIGFNSGYGLNIVLFACDTHGRRL